MKTNIINFVAVIIIAMGMLAVTAPTYAQKTLQKSCDGSWELECDETPNYYVCCSICSTDGELGQCIIAGRE